MTLDAQQVFNQAYGYFVSHEDCAAASANLSAFFQLLHKKAQQLDGNEAISRIFDCTTET